MDRRGPVPTDVIIAVLVTLVVGATQVEAQEPHAMLTWSGPATCLACHEGEAREVHGSVMYQWQGETPEMVSGPARQGKIAGGVNSYCINISGNWGGCGGCHVGLGVLPDVEPTRAQLENIDCLICHQEGYRRVKSGGVFVPDTAAMTISMDEAVRTVHLPTRATCLQCHAKAGGGDAVKRGDLSLAHAATVDRPFDVHMSTTGGDLRCQACHITSGHRVAGRGSDLRPSDSDIRVECTGCHADMVTGHEGGDVDRHIERVACQSCHIPVYAKDASDSTATEATEIHRTWLDTHSTHVPYHPAAIKGNDLVPAYRWWDRYSRNYLLHEVASLDPATGRYPTSRPLGSVSSEGAKLYPFKYKTAEQPIVNRTRQLIALDTSVFFASADAASAVEQGLLNMGLASTEGYSWVETDTFQLLNHEVAPAGQALACADCHGGSRVDLENDLGYGLKDTAASVCTQCHEYEASEGFAKTHEKHVKDKRYDCSWCHGFSRAERGLRLPPDAPLFADDFEAGHTFGWVSRLSTSG
jgi:hypothetical protein